MKFNLNRALILSIIILFSTYSANAQFANNNRQKTALMFAVGGGLGIFEGPASLMGANVTVELRKPLKTFGKDYSLTANFSGSATFGSLVQGSGDGVSTMAPTSMLSLNFNAFSQATKISRNAFGGFLGIGMFFTTPMTQDKTIINDDGQEVTETQRTGMIGPAVVMGPRFKLGRTYMDLRMHIGVVMSNPSLMNAGLNLMFTFGMNY